MLKHIELKSLLEKAVRMMKEKQVVEYESILDSFIERYENVLEQLSKEDDVNKVDFKKIKSCTRMYTEASSNYRQEFLNALSAVEKHIKK